ncbi:MAG: hypothetical protein IJ147_12345 [Lachnospiraceae bacterium]|nr:hypothetical protein [Lachnospiraceae bacterium]
MMKEMEEIKAIVDKIVAYLDTSKPGDPRNEKVIKTLAQFDADMAKAYAEREVNIKREFAKIEKERKEHRKNQMTILYKKYVDAAQAEKEERRRHILQQLRNLEQDVLNTLHHSRGEEEEEESEEAHQEWVKKIESEWEIWSDKEEFEAELHEAVGEDKAGVIEKSEAEDKADEVFVEVEDAETVKDGETVEDGKAVKDGETVKDDKAVKGAGTVKGAGDDADAVTDAEQEGSAAENSAKSSTGKPSGGKPKDPGAVKEKQVLTNKEKQMQVYTETAALYEALNQSAVTGEDADALKKELWELKQYMDGVAQEYRAGSDGKDKMSQAALYFDRQRGVTSALRVYLDKGVQPESRKAVDLLEKLEKLCVSEEASVVNGMRELYRPQLEEKLKKEDELRQDSSTDSEEYSKSVARSAEMIRNLNGKMWSPMEGETLTAFCERVRGYVEAAGKGAQMAEEPEQKVQSGENAAEKEQSSKRVRKVTNEQLREEIIRRADPNDPYIMAEDMKQYDIKAKRKQLKEEIRILRVKTTPQEEMEEERKKEKKAQAEKKEKKAQAEKKAQKTEGVKPPELSMTDQGWNIL